VNSFIFVEHKFHCFRGYHQTMKFSAQRKAYLTIDIAKYQNEEIKSKQTSHSLPIHTNWYQRNHIKCLCYHGNMMNNFLIVC